ncbi:EAL and HDOD domain-containing protein [Neptunomonas phycophila]|uniref:EAL and HDOD domain-containing protein n=1 Tax=Neptunomonas phycophila TaxID=1572645 RepID=UPI003514F843
MDAAVKFESFEYHDAAPYAYQIAKQAIVDKRHRTIAHELLFRAAPDRTTDYCGSCATRHVFDDVINAPDVELPVGDLFVNMTRDILMALPLNSRPLDHVVYEILEDVEVDAALMTHLHALVDQGYQFALDDYVLTENARPLLTIASIVKLDIQSLSTTALIQHVHALRSSSCLLLAEKIETPNEWRLCHSLGFDLFQGFLFHVPDVLVIK